MLLSLWVGIRLHQREYYSARRLCMSRGLYITTPIYTPHQTIYYPHLTRFAYLPAKISSRRIHLQLLNLPIQWYFLAMCQVLKPGGSISGWSLLWVLSESSSDENGNVKHFCLPVTSPLCCSPAEHNQILGIRTAAVHKRLSILAGALRLWHRRTNK